MIKIKRKLSLTLKLTVSVLAAVAVALLGYILIIGSVNLYINNFYISSSAEANRYNENINSFSEYVSANNLSVRNAKMLNRWVNERKYVYLMIYSGNDTVFESGWIDDDDFVDDSQQNYAITESNDGDILTDTDEYPGSLSDLYSQVTFSDGTYGVDIIDFSESRIYTITNIVSLVAAAVLLIIVVVSYNKHVTNRIVRLANEVKVIEKTDINGNISVIGNDEITGLSDDVDKMRQRIIEQLSAEQNAWNANRELITSMAHDIRTPLTVLSGYLALLKEDEYKTDEEREHYLDISISKAEQLRDLSDKLFEYFYVFGKSGTNIHYETVDASLLLQQLLGEIIIILREEGFIISSVELNECVPVQIDIQYLKRIIDNIFSNIRKYADKSKEISVSAVFSDGHVIIKVENYCNSNITKKESTGIGLLSCKSMAEDMNCSFVTEIKDGMFRAKFSIPVCKEEDNL